MLGGPGDDTLRPHEFSSAAMNGGTGVDTVNGSGFFEHGMVFDAAGADVEIILGSDRDDDITGTDAAETIDGRGGDDVIRGLGGNDTLTGGRGSDRIEGGAGDDTVFAKEEFPDGSVDTVDGGPGTDSAALDEEDVRVSIERLLA